jgi:murein DD-endopeptidase MepM/ murein hydrolase activator NlpD
VPVPSLTAWPPLATRLVIALCAFTLLGTALLTSTGPVAASGLSVQISQARQSQSYAQGLMRAADSAFQGNRSAYKETKRQWKRLKREVKAGKRAFALSKKVLAERRSRLNIVEALYENPAEAPKPWKYRNRLREVRRDVRVAKARKVSIGKRLRANTRARNSAKYRKKALKRQRGALAARRRSAEASVAAGIIRMTALARQRVEVQTNVSLASGGTFSWPTTGRISQTYGCTGFYLNPRRGSCRHFHDGLDIVDSYGTPVRAAAVGVVAYSGWNPWDKSGRAWIVVVVHPDGFVSRYGHLTSNKRARVGQLVHTGQIIGKMGNTGRSTGTHLHFELLKGSSDVSPLAYLPRGVVKIVVDKSGTKKARGGKKKSTKRKAARKKAAKARKARAAKRRAASEATTAASTTLADPCSDLALAAVPAVVQDESPFWFLAAGALEDAPTVPCEPEVVDDEPIETLPSEIVHVPALVATASVDQSSSAPERPGVRLRFRGTSPSPR